MLLPRGFCSLLVKVQEFFKDQEIIHPAMKPDIISKLELGLVKRY